MRGRNYDNGLTLRAGVRVTAAWERPYIPQGYVHYPHYNQTYFRDNSVDSPFGFYFGVALPFLNVSFVQSLPPTVVFIDPVRYNGNRWVGFSDADEPNLLEDTNLDSNEPGLNNALDEICEAYQSSNIDGLVALTEPSVSVGIYERGLYQYTLSAGDFLDLTRDAMSNVHTLGFKLLYVHRRASGIFSVCARHAYQGKNAEMRSVYVNYVLQDFGGHWTITALGTSPDLVQNM
jgi:hypothetical protein